MYRWPVYTPPIWEVYEASCRPREKRISKTSLDVRSKEDPPLPASETSSIQTMNGQRPLRNESNDRLFEASGRPVAGTRFDRNKPPQTSIRLHAVADQLDSQEQKTRGFPSLAPTNSPAPRKEPRSTQMYEPLRAEGIHRAISTPEGPVWRRREGDRPILCNNQEEVVVMQHSQQDAWKWLGRKFESAHEHADASNPPRTCAAPVSRTSPETLPVGTPRVSRYHTDARRRSVDHSGDSAHCAGAPRITNRRSSLPDQQRSPSSCTLPLQLRSPAVALKTSSKATRLVYVRGAGAGLGPRPNMYSRQMRRQTDAAAALGL